MVSKWEKLKFALGMNSCVYGPRTSEETHVSSESGHRLSNVSLISKSKWTLDSSVSRLSRSGSKSSKNSCSICLFSMRRGDGHAIFTAECSHSFHFHCITSNVKHGNQVCPVCRAKWKEIPFQSPAWDPPQTDTLMPVVRSLPPTRRIFSRHVSQFHHNVEPPVFDDDDSLDPHSEPSKLSAHKKFKAVQIEAFPEISSTPRLKSHDEFTVLVHLNALGSSQIRTSRASVDIVTVLDVSGSMAGTKLALLKRAMGFVIQNLGSSDRLSIVAFSSSARRIFPLRRMSGSGHQQALQAVNSLFANGGTNIVEGLKKGAKVMEQRREKNVVASLILLSDGQDTYSINDHAGSRPNYRSLLPTSARDEVSRFPVHAFGFGADHDSYSMHSISDASGGTFSFIETELVIQDAFAQCIGGLLSVVAQEVHVRVECARPTILLSSLKSGSYASHVVEGREGFIDVGDLYADEERDFMVSVNVPPEPTPCDSTLLLNVACAYKDPFTSETVCLDFVEVKIGRPEMGGAEEVVSVEVDRQRNRVCAADAMSRARESAERGDLNEALSILKKCRTELSVTASSRVRDRLWVALDAELKEMQERLGSRQVYESSGRAYILSGLSSHSLQRATARGDSTDGLSLVQTYQTPLMTEMLTRSQAMQGGAHYGRLDHS